MGDHATSLWTLAAFRLSSRKFFGEGPGLDLPCQQLSLDGDLGKGSHPCEEASALGISSQVIPQELWIADIHDDCILGLDFLRPHKSPMVNTWSQN